MRVAAAAWEIRPAQTEEGFYSHLREFAHAAAVGVVDLLVLPELLVLELLPMHGEVLESEVPARLAVHADRLEAELAALSAEFNLLVVGGTHFRKGRAGVANVCCASRPQGASLHPKNRLTRYERTVWGLVPGHTLALTSDPRVGVAICYDLEFPECGRALAEAGAVVLCAPSFTETEHGFYRVRYAAHARALENQVFVLHAALVGSLGREPVPSTYGSAAVVAPPHEPFPALGILAETPLNTEGLALAELDFDALEACRKGGAVLNWADRGGEWRVQT